MQQLLTTARWMHGCTVQCYRYPPASLPVVIAGVGRHVHGRSTALKRSPFLKSVAAIAGGTAVAQAIAFLFSPVVTRMYGPEAIGVLGVFNSLVVVLGPIGSLSLAQAVTLPENQEDASSLLKIGLLSTVLFGFMLLIPVAFFRKDLSMFLGVGTVLPYMWFLPAVSVAVGAGQLFEGWAIRQRRFRILGAVRAGESLVVGSGKVGFGVLWPTEGVLIIAATLGRFANAAALFLVGSPKPVRSAREFASLKDQAVWKSLFQQYRDYPLLRTPQNTLSSLSRNVPLLLFSSIFGSAVAGYYSIGLRVLQLPIVLVSRSVGKVLFPRLVEAVRKDRPLRPLVLRATLSLAAIGILPFAVVFVFGPAIFAFVFGDEWREAGLYARWLAPWLFLGFVNVPSVQSLPLTKSQGFLLVWEVCTTIARVAAVLFTANIAGRVLPAVQLYAAVGSLSYIVLIVEAFRRAGRVSRVRRL